MRSTFSQRKKMALGLLMLCWHNIHHSHHKWTGWRREDPTIPYETISEASSSQKRLMDFVWKYWSFLAITTVFTINILGFPVMNWKNILHPIKM